VISGTTKSALSFAVAAEPIDIRATPLKGVESDEVEAWLVRPAEDRGAGA